MKRKQGLIPLTPDTRDIKVGQAFTLPPLSELPKEFEIAVPDEWIGDQKQSSACAGFATSLASSTQEGVPLDPLFTWVVARAGQGIAIDEFGIELRPMLSAHVKIGAIRKESAPHTVDEPVSVYADITKYNMAGLLQVSVYAKKGSYVWVTPTQGYDMFDTIRACIKKFDTPVIIGMAWAYSDTVIDKWEKGGFGHALLIQGWKAGRLIAVNSWGLSSGNKGRYYISREVINRNVPVYGGGLFIDETPDNLRYHIQNGLKLDDSWIKSITKPFLLAILDLLKQLKQKLVGTLPPFPEGIEKLAQLLEKYEIKEPGAEYPYGSIGFRYNNPVNSKFHFGGYHPKYGKVECGERGFAKFPTMELGRLYARNMLYYAAKGQSSVYRSSMTLLDFIKVFAPSSDGNNPIAYAKWLRERGDWSSTTTLFDLLDNT